MHLRSWTYLAGAVVLTFMAACATAPQDPGGPLDGPLPPGTYELAADVSYRADSDRLKHDAHASFSARLYVSVDGTIELYSGEYRCVDPRTLPGYQPRREWKGGNPGHHFACGDSNWTLWANHEGRVFGRLSATVDESVQGGMKCLLWNYDSGRAVCEKYGPTVSSGRRTVTSPVSVKKVEG